MDYFHYAFEWPEKITAKEYRQQFPSAVAALESAFNHHSSTAKLGDYPFDQIVRPWRDGVNHRVVYQPKEKKHGPWDVGPLGFDVFEKDNGWAVEPPYVLTAMSKWGD